VSAALKTLEAVAGETRTRRGRQRDGIRSAVLSTPGGADKHVHCVFFLEDDGNGFTLPGPDGHIHKVTALEILPVLGHGHGISAQRCTKEHNRKTGRHVQVRR
jgi:hypothetical protein